MTDLHRRTFLAATAATAITPALAGCSGDGGGDGGGAPSEVDDYLSDANEYDGSVEDATGQDEATVEVGAGNGLAFDPAAIRVDSGTTVVWNWTGQGGDHNVVDEDGAFESELYDEAGEHFEFTFDEAGNYTYYCNPHQSAGMLAAVVVE